MKKLLLSLTLVGAVATAYGQGSINFSGNLANRLSTQQGAGAIALVPTTVGLMDYGVMYGIGATAPATLSYFAPILGVNSSTSAGGIANSSDRKSLINNIALGADTSSGETDVWLQIVAWSANYATPALALQAFGTTSGVAYGLSEIVNANALGNPTISGATIWEGSTGTNPKLINAFVIPVSSVPEPGTFALAGLGAAALLIFRRRK